MSLITLEKISHYYTDKAILDNINLSLTVNDKIGLVGRNGCGKTTFLKIIAKELEPSYGNVYYAKNVKIAYLKQEMNFNISKSLYDFIVESNIEYLNLKKQLENLQSEVSKSNDKKSINKLQKLQEQFEHTNGYTFETNVKMILTSLNFSQDVWDKKVNDFSGGEKTRIQLAKILSSDFDYLLLDEPTNHLDIKMIFWLEKYLKTLGKPFLMISHDRYFLNVMVNKIFHLTNGKINVYKGNYKDFEKAYSEKKQLLEKQAKKQQEFIKKTKEFIDKNIAGQKTKQAKSRQKQLEKLKKINLFEEEKNIKLKINAEKRSGNDVFILEDVSFSYSHKKIFEKINVGIYYKDRIAILGKNGSGKTTFLKLLNGELLPKSGIIKRGSGITIGYYDQMHIELNDTLTVFETIKELAFLETKGYVYSYLARFGFTGEDTEKKVSALSGGEKSRLYLAKLIHNKPNVLILDEPTNHLDIPMIQSLENALLDYEGTIIFVSHDVTFIKNVSNRIFLLENYNLWEKFDEPDIVLKSLFVKSEIKKKTKNIANKQRKKRINPILLEKKQKQIEEKNKLLDECKNKLTEYQNKFSDAVFMKNPDNVKNLNKLIDETNNKIADLEEKLDELETEYLLMLEEE